MGGWVVGWLCIQRTLACKVHRFTESMTAKKVRDWKKKCEGIQRKLVEIVRRETESTTDICIDDDAVSIASE